jgi:hypothetical protein
MRQVAICILLLVCLTGLINGSRLQHLNPNKLKNNKVEHVRGFGVPKGFQRNLYNNDSPAVTPIDPTPFVPEQLLDDISHSPKTIAKTHILDRKNTLAREHVHGAALDVANIPAKSSPGSQDNGFFRQLTLILVVMV